jgi:hypothetical protein
MSSNSFDRVLDFDIPVRPGRRLDATALRETTTAFVESAMMVRDLDPTASDRDRAVAAIAAFTWAQRLLHQVAEGLAYAA